MQTYQHIIGGERLDATDGATFESLDPATGTAWYRAARGTAEDVDRAVRAARTAFEDPRWRDITQTQRGRLIRRLGDLIAENAERLAVAEASDNGKLIREMRGQMAGLPDYYHYFAGWADKIHGEVIPGSRRELLNYTLREPAGVIGAITPWNSPLLLTTLKLAPALTTGCTMVIKPSEHTSASLLEMMALIEEAGFPPGVVNVVTGAGETGRALVEHPGVDKLAFTGSTETGRRVAEAAGRRLVRVTLELGGKSPNIVFADADLQSASMGIVAGVFAAAGQTCIAGSRVFVHRDVFDDVLGRVVERARRIKIGNPLDAATEMGPLALAQQLEKVKSYVAIGAGEDGATIVTGGQQPAIARETGGWYFEPTVFTDVRNDMRVAREEIFGPVVGFMPFSDEDEVVRLANDTPYGLAAGVWTRNLGLAHRMAARLEAGVVWINTYRAMAPQVPFGGMKQSGLGRENGYEVLREYTKVKSVWVNTSDEPMGDPFVMR